MQDEDLESNQARVVVRLLEPSDAPQIISIQRASFPDIAPWSVANIEEHIETFPEGQIGVELDGTLVASSSSLIVNSDDFSDQHTFKQVVPMGFLSNHDAEGDALYGVDICVHPDQRGLRLARRIYEARQQLVRKLNLRKFMIAGRLPRYSQSELEVREYVAAVVRKEEQDPVLTTQLANGFVIRNVLENYLPSDRESQGYAVLMEWANATYTPNVALTRRAKVRVAAVQYQMREIESFDDFMTQTQFFIETASDYRADFVLFPELLTNQLLGLLPQARPGARARALDTYTERYLEFFTSMAIKYNVNIIGGTHLTVVEDVLYNIAYLFRRDGTVGQQRKIHITPSEARWWGVAPGEDVNVFDTDRGKIAIAICYDSEFPEYARMARHQGAQILFVPYNTDLRSGHIRVRTCSAARCIENHMYAVLSGCTGNLPFVDGADIHFAQGAILTPSDIPFDRDGIAAEATPNIETMLVHELDLDLLRRTERNGTVRPWADRRGDLYEVRWGDQVVRGQPPRILDPE